MVTQIANASSTLSNANSKPRVPITIRPARLWEASAIGRIAAATYYDTGLTAYLAPHRAKYYSHYERGFIHRAWQRMLDPRNLTFVAVSPSSPSIPVGYVQFVRLGDDEGAKRQIASRKSLLLAVAVWMFWVYCLIEKLVVGEDKSSDPAREQEFAAEAGGIGDQYWSVEGRLNRWHTQSCVVKEEWQGKGIGKKLMAEAIARAEAESVVVALEASEEGEWMYRSVGFELLGRFKTNFGNETGEDAGGVMMYTPVKRRV